LRLALSLECRAASERDREGGDDDGTESGHESLRLTPDRGHGDGMLRVTVSAMRVGRRPREPEPPAQRVSRRNVTVAVRGAPKWVPLNGLPKL
jgi:hypothetical protein